MSEGSFITDEMRAAIGVEGEPVVHEIEKGAIRRFAAAIGDPNPLYRDEAYAKTTKYGGIIAPPTFYCTLGGRQGARLTNLPPRLLNGGSEYEIHKPLRPGDKITAVTRLKDLFERSGKNGRMLFSVSETVLTNQNGELVAKVRGTLINFD